MQFVWLPGSSVCYMVLIMLFFSSNCTCEDGGGDHFALLAPSDSVDTDLIFCSRKQTGQGVVGDITVNHHAVHSTYRKHHRETNIRASELLPSL